MYDSENLKELFKLNPEGYIEALGQRVVVFRMETWATIRATILDLLGQEGGYIILSIIGEKIGRSSAKIGKERGLVTGLDEKTFKTVSNIYLRSGWGRRDYEMSDDKIIIRIHHSFEADAHMTAFGKSETPVCHFVRGYIKGFISELVGHDVHVEETKCIAKGDEYCEFVVSI